MNLARKFMDIVKDPVSNAGIWSAAKSCAVGLACGFSFALGAREPAAIIPSVVGMAFGLATGKIIFGAVETGLVSEITSALDRASVASGGETWAQFRDRMQFKPV